MLLLHVILWVALALLAAALLLWLALLLSHAAEARREKRAAAMGDFWLDRLLPVLGGESESATLPAVRNREELDVVLALLRELLDRFSGSYREKLGEVLSRVGAESYGLKLLQNRAAHERLRGAALLAWCGDNETVDRALLGGLGDRDARVRLEAADALVRRGVKLEAGPLLVALEKEGIGRSLRTRDLFRRWGSTTAVDWQLWLHRDWNEDARVLLLEAANASGTCEAELFSKQAGHPSPRVVIASLHALESAADPAGAAAARAVFSHKRPQVRRQAARTLGACGGTLEDREALFRLLEDESFEVRKAAFAALLHTGAATALAQHRPADRWQEELYREAGLAAPAGA